MNPETPPPHPTPAPPAGAGRPAGQPVPRAAPAPAAAGETALPTLVVRRIGDPSGGDPLATAEPLTIGHFMAKSAPERPTAVARLGYDDGHLYLGFEVAERHVRCVATEYQGRVWEDSCVEFFVQPKPDLGYFNFEVNCGGTLLLFYIDDPQTATPAGGFSHCERVPWEWGRQVRIATTLPQRIADEIPAETRYRVEVIIPLALFAAFVGPLGPLPGQVWRANFNKCAHSSHPHWATWAPLAGGESFHNRARFGELRFV